MSGKERDLNDPRALRDQSGSNLYDGHLTFCCVQLHLRFRAEDEVAFPPGKAANVLRGAFGMEAPEGIFAPRSAGGPSGLADLPRPFVLRARELDGRTFRRGTEFGFGIHIFDVPQAPAFASVFGDVARKGWGPGRGRAELAAAEARTLRLSLEPAAGLVRSILVHFVSPTELKAEQRVVERPEFGVLFARIRDRISTLRTVYGEGPLDIDFRAIGERAAAVRMTRCEVEHQSVERFSTRTRQTHPLGGFTGVAEYEGDHLEEFVPWLEAAAVTGVGRQTTWGKGEIHTEVLR